MCGRYALALRPSQIRRMLEDYDMPVYEAPDDPDNGNDENAGDGGQADGYDGPRQSYNFAPGYRGVVYRADVPDWGAGPRSRHSDHASTDASDAPSSSPRKQHNQDADQQTASIDNHEVRYKLQTMKWGLIPFWTKRNPGYGSVMKTINCRDDSLAQSGGMWSSMKARKRCIVTVQGFYEWLKKDGGREKMPHFVKRKDGKMMLLAGLWDVVQYENDEEKYYTYTIITTDSNKQLNFLHDRMPVILDNGSEKLRKWLDPKRHEWSKELQSLLVPYDGELEVYPVSKDVGKVGNNSPTFIIPIDSKENKSNIANFFAKGGGKKESKSKIKEENETSETQDMQVKTEQPEVELNETEGFAVKSEDKEDEDYGTTSVGIKREAGEDPTDEERPKKLSNAAALNKLQGTKDAVPPPRKGRQKISATSNNSRTPTRNPKSAGTQKITKFFANSS
ncbi:hypothetical protein F5Y03DRAFT_362599 [Xylaria venustula]|nr:hypothetical protein F5Y03DRAFT_362599 [Xylaria venustula]